MYIYLTENKQINLLFWIVFASVKDSFLNKKEIDIKSIKQKTNLGSHLKTFFPKILLNKSKENSFNIDTLFVLLTSSNKIR
jgi:hypothetical protein